MLRPYCRRQHTLVTGLRVANLELPANPLLASFSTARGALQTAEGQRAAALGQHSLDSMNNKRREDERAGAGREKGGWGRYEQYTSMKLSKSKIF